MTDEILSDEQERSLRLAAEGSYEGMRAWGGRLAADRNALRARIEKLSGLLREWCDLPEEPAGRMDSPIELHRRRQALVVKTAEALSQRLSSSPAPAEPQPEA